MVVSLKYHSISALTIQTFPAIDALHHFFTCCYISIALTAILCENI